MRADDDLWRKQKVTGELLSDYYFKRFGVDTRSVRFPGLISYTTPPEVVQPTYAVDIFYSAVEGEKFVCPIGPDTKWTSYVYAGCHTGRNRDYGGGFCKS